MTNQNEITILLEEFIDTVRENYQKTYEGGDGGYAFTLGYYSSFTERFFRRYVPQSERDKFVQELKEEIEALKKRGNFGTA